MQRALLILLVLSAACDTPSPPPTSMPWVNGFTTIAVSDTATPAASELMSRLTAASQQDDYGALALRADLLGDARTETVLASYWLGVVVVGTAGRVIARAPGLEPEGSADDILAIAVGDAQLATPVLMVASQSGGHRESTVSLAIYRMIASHTLQPLFAAPIEVHDGDATRTGSVMFVRGGLLYRAPDAAVATPWTIDPRLGRYVERGARPGIGGPAI